ncbi:MAG: hypothetical protein MUE50_11915 [Pirellulaceae bacterium]|nr:hypothetical protein [Pirellulaceae bacterium]
MRILLLYGTDGSDIRTVKLCRSLSRQGHEVHFVGWHRLDGAANSLELAPNRVHVLRWAASDRVRAVLGQLAFTLFVMRWLIALRPHLVYAANEDNLLRVACGWRWLYGAAVCDLYDGLYERFSEVRGLPGKLLRGLCQLARNVADRIVVTDERRWQLLTPRQQAQAAIVENSPLDPGEDLASTAVRGPVRIFVSGSIAATRGLATLLAAVQRVPDARIVAAGWLGDELARTTFQTHPQVEFHGSLTSDQSLRLAAACDILFAFYAPSNRNQLYASPNKVSIVINSEALVSAWVIEQGLGSRCAYDDDKTLGEILASLADQRSALPAFSRRARALFVQDYSWETMERRLTEVLSGLGLPDVPEKPVGAAEAGPGGGVRADRRHIPGGRWLGQPHAAGQERAVRRPWDSSCRIPEETCRAPLPPPK